MATTTQPYYCYILYNDKNTLTYVGITNNLTRRIRQHNTEIEGGAIYTTRMVRKHGVSWKFLCAFTFDSSVSFDRNVAMSVEWHLKFAARTRKGYRSHVGRLQSIPFVLSNKKIAVHGHKPDVYIDEAFISIGVQVLGSTCNVKAISEILPPKPNQTSPPGDNSHIVSTEFVAHENLIVPETAIKQT